MTDSYGRDLDLNLLRVFTVVAEERSLTRAAVRLYVTQPAVSASMRRLTEFVGADLVTRQGRGVTLTARGSELLGAAGWRARSCQRFSWRCARTRRTCSSSCGPCSSAPWRS